MSATEQARRLRLPDVVIAGVTKAGTTSLFAYLAQHPDVCAADNKELRYFTPIRHGEPMQPIEDYAEHFTHWTGERYAMEATPGYFYGGRPLAAAMDRTLPEVRVVVSLREPGARCWSWYGFVRSRARIPKDMTFSEYLDRCEELHRVGRDHLRENQPYWGLGGGCYATWFDDWADLFGDRLEIVSFDDVVAEPAGTTEGLCRWLGIDAAAARGFDYQVENKTEQYRNKVLQRAALTVNRRAEGFFLQHRVAKRRLRSAYYAVNRDSASLSMGGCRSRLDDFFAPHNERLAAALTESRRSVPVWAR